VDRSAEGAGQSAGAVWLLLQRAYASRRAQERRADCRCSFSSWPEKPNCNDIYALTLKSDRLLAAPVVIDLDRTLVPTDTLAKRFPARLVYF